MLAGCSSADTVLALTIKSGPDIGIVSKMRVTVTPSSGSPVTGEFVPPLDTAPDAGGVVSPSFFHRMTISGDPKGEAFVTVEALNAAGAVFAVGSTTAILRANAATTASVTLTLGTTPPLPDGGVDGAADAGAPPDATDDTADTDAATLDVAGSDDPTG